MIGVIFSILSAASFGLNTASVRRGRVRGSALQGVYVTVFVGVPLFVLAAAGTGQLFRYQAIATQGYVLLAIAGVLHFLFGRYCGYRALGILGANRLASLESISTMLAVVLGVVILGESLTPLKILGIVLILIGPAVMIGDARRHAPAPVLPASPNPAERTSGTPEELGAVAAQAIPAPAIVRHEPTHIVEGVIFALLNAAAFGTSPILIRSALSGTGLGVMGALVAYAAAGAVLALTLPLPGRFSLLTSLDKRTLWWFNLGAVTVFSAQLFRFLALSVAPASIVTPMIRTGAVFTLFFAFLLNRKLESFGGPVLLGIVLAVAGAVLLAF